MPGHRLHRHLSPHLPFPPPGKVPGFPAKTVHFPLGHEASGEVQQGMLGEVLSIQVLWKRASAGPGVKRLFCGKKRAVQQIAKIYAPNNQHNTFGRCVGHCKSSKFLLSQPLGKRHFPHGRTCHRLYRHIWPHLLFPPAECL